MPNLAKICILFCGGTIAMRVDPKSNALVPSTSTQELINLIPDLAAIAQVSTEYVTNVDSSNIMPRNWVEIARRIEKLYDQYDGFVVTHGTDTMAYTASALSFLLQGLSKPIIFTGSQRPLEDKLGSDARNNLIFATTFATLDIAEVCIFFGFELMRANRVRKFSQFDFDAFKSFNLPALGKIGLRPSLAEHRQKRSKRQLSNVVNLDKKVFLLKYFPGLDPHIISNVIDMGYAGIVIEGVGAGNLPSEVDFASAIKAALTRGVPVVMTTQCIVGAAEMHIYEVGKLIEQSGAISVLDMTCEAALSKLAWALTQSNDIIKISNLMRNCLVGEISSEILD